MSKQTNRSLMWDRILMLIFFWCEIINIIRGDSRDDWRSLNKCPVFLMIMEVYWSIFVFQSLKLFINLKPRCDFFSSKDSNIKKNFGQIWIGIEKISKYSEYLSILDCCLFGQPQSSIFIGRIMIGLGSAELFVT